MPATDRDARVAAYKPSENDWPVLLHVVVKVRGRVGTEAFLAYTDTLPPNEPGERVKVVYSSDSIQRDPGKLIEVLETIIKQFHRQLAHKS